MNVSTRENYHIKHLKYYFQCIRILEVFRIVHVQTLNKTPRNAYQRSMIIIIIFALVLGIKQIRFHYVNNNVITCSKNTELSTSSDVPKCRWTLNFPLHFSRCTKMSIHVKLSLTTSSDVPKCR